MNPPDWSIVIFGRNEAATLRPCLEAVFAAIGTRRAEVHVVLNGCTDLSPAIASGLAASAPVLLKVWRIGFADKSNAWNQYVHAIRPAAATHIFVDAYAMVAPDAFALLQQALDAAPEANAAAAVPSCGRSAAATRAAMLEAPALHGSLHALRGTFLNRVAERGLRLPVGLYRGDGLVGSMLMHDLDPGSAWNPRRIAVAAEASWRIRPLSPFRPADLKRWWNRRVQQARGAMEDAALRHAIYARGFARLPRYADAMLLDWLSQHPAAGEASLFSRLAEARLRRPRWPRLPELEPRPAWA